MLLLVSNENLLFLYSGKAIGWTIGLPRLSNQPFSCEQVQNKMRRKIVFQVDSCTIGLLSF